MKITIDRNSHGRLIARDEDGNCVAGPISTTCNPAAMDQIIAKAEALGEIDWENSQLSQPAI